MIRLVCPTGCGPVRRPWALRAEAVRCENCTAWLAAPERCEDGSLVEARVVAAPGRQPPAAARAGPHPVWPLALALALILAAIAALLSR